MNRANLVTFSILGLLSTGSAARSNDVVCDREPVSMLFSPENKWIAMVLEGSCSNGMNVTVSMDTVQLVPRASLQAVRLGSSPDEVEHDNDILAVDYYGHFENRPILKWTSPKDLQITIPNLAFPNLKKDSYQGVTIVLKYDPDDPVARERWRTEHGLPRQ